ncbi:hypothetical protein LJR066_005718 [Acidovorax sp. LjRoot66]|uniref:hypothetical protein n=1 Tax=Acidovorax sp. LjRoot66 TaxID=3342334 RepID=UPI003ECEDFC4
MFVPEGADKVSDAAMEMPATCEKHGAYQAKRPYRGSTRWHGCPTCDRERQAAEDREAKEALEMSHLTQRLRKSGLQPRMLAASFTSFVCDAPGQAAVLAACRSFVDDLSPAAGGGLWLIGPPGTGKTHLGSSMVQHVIRAKRQQACLFSSRQVITMQRASWGSEKGGRGSHRSATDPWDVGDADPMDFLRTTADVVEFLADVPLLVLDEIGVGFHSNAEQVQMYDVIDARYQQCRPTVVISNLPPAEMKTALGERSYDRLREGARVLTCNWPSARSVNRAPGPEGQE